MPYVRISIMKPKVGEEERVRSLLTELVQYYQRQPGFISGYRLEHRDGSQLHGRVGVWEREEDAEHAAIAEHGLALRSALDRATVEDSREEHAFEGTVPGAR